MKENMAMVTIADLHMGSMICSMTLISPAPSSLADSTISSGICLKDWRSMKMPKASAPMGRICGQRELMSFALDIIR